MVGTSVRRRSVWDGWERHVSVTLRRSSQVFCRPLQGSQSRPRANPCASVAPEAPRGQRGPLVRAGRWGPRAGTRRAPYEPPIRGINEGQLFSSLLEGTVWGTAKILGSLPFSQPHESPPPATLSPLASQKHSCCRRPIPFHSPGLARSSLSAGPASLPLVGLANPREAEREGTGGATRNYLSAR